LIVKNASKSWRFLLQEYWLIKYSKVRLQWFKNSFKSAAYRQLQRIGRKASSATFDD
jgi:hypothetical protein